MKKLIIIATALLALSKANAQQDIHVSQYMFNGLVLNPAYAGSHPFTSATLLYRAQWVNLPGAPRVSVLSVDGPVKDKNMGLGLLVSNDRIGAMEQTDIYGNYAYQLKMEKGKLAFGLKAGVSNYIFKSNDLSVWDANDEVFAGRRNQWLPKAGAGVYYFCDEWYAGLSAPALLAYEAGNSFSFDMNQATFVNRHYYLTGGYVFKLNEDFRLKPSTLIKYEPAAPVQCDLNLNLLYNEMLWSGVSFRTGDAVTFMVEYQTTFRLRMGYAYDLTFSKLRNYSSGTHEIMLGYDIGKKQTTKIKSARYF